MSLASALRALDYPCEYPLKLVVRPEAVDDIRARLQGAAPHDAALNMHQRASRNGRYIALTAKFTANNAEEIEALYAGLASAEGIVMSL